MKIFGRFSQAVEDARTALQLRSHLVHTARWQGMDISEKPEMATYEILNHSFSVPLVSEDLVEYRREINPNIPWADDHFNERVNGFPLNPGVQWANWPYAKSADRFRSQGKFTHTYMERYWPKSAGEDRFEPNYGIRFQWGDLADVVTQLQKEPDTRQAYLPIWFPEDTGALHGGRLPCTLGYHFIMRANNLHIVYYLRSCDFVRHFRDDIYLTVRLLLWMLQNLRDRDDNWENVRPGMYTMHITSFHLFKADYVPLFGKPRVENI